MRNPVTSSEGGGALVMPKDIGVSESDARAIEVQWDTIDAVDARLRSQGILPSTIPNVVCPEVTAEMLLTPDTNAYTTMYSAQNRRFNHVTRCLADVRAMLLQVTNEMEDIEATKRRTFRERDEGKKKTEKMGLAEMADHILADPHYRALKLQHQQYEQQRFKLDAKAKELESNMAVVSRQITIRGLEATQGGREGNIQNQASRWDRGPRG